MSDVQIAVSKDFLDAFSRLPGKLQKKAREFIEKFARDPRAGGLNLERVRTAVDDKVRSARIDQDYRAIVIEPPRGDVWLVVWVDHHDEAYRWAAGKRFEVNPRTGQFQLFEAVAGAAPPLASPPAAAREARLFAALDDEDLLLAGIPAPLLPAVRALGDEPALDAIAPHLPADAAEMLYLLAAGYSLPEAMNEAERSRAQVKPVDVQDFRKALSEPAAEQSFKLVATDQDLKAMLETPLEQWRIFLHPSQRRLVEMRANGPVRVLGGAGTGKTVVLMHRARYLLERVFTGPDDRILVTTFSRNLALDLGHNLKNLCGDAARRLDVVNLHQWAGDFMRRHGHGFPTVADEELKRLMDSAVAEADEEGLSASFYLDEWRHVIQPQEVMDRDAYLTARRTGRKRRLTRAQRARVWNVFERHRERMARSGRFEFADLIRETRRYIERQGISPLYRAVLADEAQDLGALELRLLRRIAPEAPDSLFLAGDGHQRIYAAPVRLGACGIDVRGRSRRLRLNYRTTAEIRRQAVAILEGAAFDDLDGETDSVRGYFSLRRGPRPLVRCFEREAEEAAFVLGQLREWMKTGPAEAICVAGRTNALLDDRYRPLLEREGIATVVVKRDPESEARKPGVRVATLHRLKGLEFARILLVGVQEGLVPLRLQAGDEADPIEHAQAERCLLYVGCTRARDELVITGIGRPSPLLRSRSAPES